eukprot:c16159_g1_i1 orf=457-1218(+)
MAHQPAHVPQFGNWDANDEVPFTVVFDNARAGKGGVKMLNPNDPAENPAAFGLSNEDASQSEEIPSKQQPAVETGSGVPTRRQSGDGQGYYRAGAADGYKRGSSAGGARENAGAEESPNHQIYQGRLGNRPGSPYWERKNPPEGGNAFAPSTPGKSRLHPGSTRANETPDRAAALPKFGAWDENDPSAGEGFTVIFNQARNEKKTGGPVRIPALQGESPAKFNYGDGNKQAQTSHHHGKKSSFWSCCLGSQTD